MFNMSFHAAHTMKIHYIVHFKNRTFLVWCAGNQKQFYDCFVEVSNYYCTTRHPKII